MLKISSKYVHTDIDAIASHRAECILVAFCTVCAAGREIHVQCVQVSHVVFMCVHTWKWCYSQSLEVKWQVRGGCSSSNQRVGERGGKEESEMESGGVEGVRRGRGVMIGWKRTEEERRRGVQRGWKQEERNERRAREWLQMGWDWQRRDGSIERE